jgi:hypothetical protein
MNRIIKICNKMIKILLNLKKNAVNLSVYNIIILLIAMLPIITTIKTINYPQISAYVFVHELNHQQTIVYVKIIKTKNTQVQIFDPPELLLLVHRFQHQTNRIKFHFLHQIIIEIIKRVI